MEKRLVPYLSTTRANPTRHFWFTKIPAGRYYLVSLIEERSGARKEEQLTGLAWLVIELDAGEKLTKDSRQNKLTTLFAEAAAMCSSSRHGSRRA